MREYALPSSKASQLAWHPAFLQAIQIELFDYRDSLEFKSEFQLTTEPLRIDLLIIKKPKELVIDKNIARIFKTDNLLEYKSPGDYLSIKDFIKVYAYANLYTAITPEVELSDVTITFVESKYPRKLIKYLTNERGYTVQKTAPGIYQVLGDYIPIQIIESKKLSESENLWLKSLRNDLEIRNADGILKETKQWQGKMPLDAYFDILLRANRNAFLEVLDMKTAPTLKSILTEAGILPEWIAQEKAEGKTEVARNLLAMQMPIEMIAQAVQMPVEKINALALGN
ncbi:MAG: hypothetical protein FWD36_08505 [Treponema sp.]|nr:hypothetical protein [Treponema sp.]